MDLCTSSLKRWLGKSTALLARNPTVRCPRLNKHQLKIRKYFGRCSISAQSTVAARAAHRCAISSTAGNEARPSAVRERLRQRAAANSAAVRERLKQRAKPDRPEPPLTQLTQVQYTQHNVIQSSGHMVAQYPPFDPIAAADADRIKLYRSVETLQQQAELEILGNGASLCSAIAPTREERELQQVLGRIVSLQHQQLVNLLDTGNSAEETATTPMKVANHANPFWAELEDAKLEAANAHAKAAAAERKAAKALQEVERAKRDAAQFHTVARSGHPNSRVRVRDSSGNDQQQLQQPVQQPMRKWHLKEQPITTTTPPPPPPTTTTTQSHSTRQNHERAVDQSGATRRRLSTGSARDHHLSRILSQARQTKLQQTKLEAVVARASAAAASAASAAWSVAAMAAAATAAAASMMAAGVASAEGVAAMAVTALAAAAALAEAAAAAAQQAALSALATALLNVAEAEVEVGPEAHPLVLVRRSIRKLCRLMHDFDTEDSGLLEQREFEAALKLHLQAQFAPLGQDAVLELASLFSAKGGSTDGHRRRGAQVEYGLLEQALTEEVGRLTANRDFASEQRFRQKKLEDERLRQRELEDGKERAEHRVELDSKIQLWLEECKASQARRGDALRGSMQNRSGSRSGSGSLDRVWEPQHQHRDHPLR
jgi:hypothetical protein